MSLLDATQLRYGALGLPFNCAHFLLLCLCWRAAGGATATLLLLLSPPLPAVGIVVLSCRIHYTEWWPNHKEKWRWIKDGASLTLGCIRREPWASHAVLTQCLWYVDVRQHRADGCIFFPVVVAQNGGLLFPGKYCFEL